MAKREMSDNQKLDAGIEFTEDEIFTEAINTRPDDNDGDRTPENQGDGLEGEHLDEDLTDGDDGDETADDKTKDGKDEVEADKKADTKDDDEKDEAGDDDDDEGDEPAQRGKPEVAVSQERRLRRAAERENDELRDSINALRNDINSLKSTTQPRKVEPVADEEPDVFADPKGFENSILNKAEHRYTLRRVEETFGDAHEEHGKEFEAAYGALTKLDNTSPTDRATVQRISKAPNPGKALMRWHREQVVAREIGDPTTYEQRTRDKLLKDPETRKQLLRELREEAEGNTGQNDRRASGKRNLPSLNSGAGRSSGRGRDADPGLHDDSDEAVFDHAFAR